MSRRILISRHEAEDGGGPMDGAKTSARVKNGIRRSVPGASVGALVGSVVQWRDGNSEAPLRLVRAIYRESRGGVR